MNAACRPNCRLTVRSPSRASRRGMVLFVVAVVTAMVALSAMGFLVSMRTENRAAHLQADQMQVEQIALSGREYLFQVVALPPGQINAWGGLAWNASMFQDVPVDWDAFGTRHGRFSIVAPWYDDETSEPEYGFGVVDTCSKISLATLLQWDDIQPGYAREVLMTLPGMNETVADSLLDWLDADDEAREFGAEAEFYSRMYPARRPANQIPRHLEDLLAVRGVNEWQMLGSHLGTHRIIDSLDAVGNAVPARRAPTTAAPNQDEDWRESGPPWSHYLTTKSAERNVRRTGEPRIWLNQPDLSQLHQALTATVDRQAADLVVALRLYGPSEVGIEQASSDPLPSPPLLGTAEFEFTSVLQLVDAVVQPPDGSSDSPKAYASPFRSRDANSLRSLAELADATTSIEATTIAGRVNIMTAPRLVLLAVPGVDETLADRILQARDAQQVDNDQRQHALWLLTEGIVDVPTMEQLLPYITVGGSIFEAQVVAYYDAHSPWARHELIIDGTPDEPRTLYYRDLSRLGRGFDYLDFSLLDERTEMDDIAKPANRREL